MTFEAKSSGDIADVFQINSRYTAAEAYSGNELYDVKLAVENNQAITNEFELYQNVPNPFNEETTISFYLPKSETVTLKIYNISGRVLRLEKLEGAKGLNSKKITKADFNATGVLYYQVKTNEKTITQKMILMD